MPPRNDSNTRPPAAPDGGYGWVVCGASFAISCLILAMGYSIGIFFDVIMKDFNCTKAEVTAFASMALSMQCLAAPIASSLHQQFSARFTAILGSALLGFAMIASAFVPSVNLLYFSYGIPAGLGLAFVYLPTRVIVTSYFYKRRSAAIGICSMGGYLGSFLLPILMRFLTAVYSWRGAFFILGPIAFNAIPAAILLLPVGERQSSENKTINKSRNHDENVDILPVIAEEEDVNYSTPQSYERPRKTPMYMRSKSSDESAQNKQRNFHHAEISRSHDHIQQMVPVEEKIPLKFKSIDNLDGNVYANAVISIQRSLGHLHEIGDNSSSGMKYHLQKYIKHLSSLSFISFLVANFFKGTIYYTPQLFIVSYGLSIDLPIEQATLLLSTVGFGNIAGRIFIAVIGDVWPKHRRLMFSLGHGIGGIFTIALLFFPNIYYLFFFVIQFGFTTGAADLLVSPIVADLTPIDELAFCLGITWAFEGLSILIGPVFLALLPTFDLMFATVGIGMVANCLGLIICDTIHYKYNQNS